MQTFFSQNRERLGERLEDQSMVVLFSGKAPKKSADEYYAFTPNRNFYYMTGVDEEEIMMILTKVQGEVKAELLIKESDPVEEKWVGKTINKEEAIEVSGISTIHFVAQFQQVIHRAIVRQEIEHVYFDLERGCFEEELTQEQTFARVCQEKYPYIILKNAFPIIEKLRVIKSDYEIQQLRQAIAVTDEGIQALMKHAKSGMMEYALEAHFDFVLKTHGIKDYAFKTIAASGSNATVLHYEANNSEIPKDSLILFDLGAQYKYYNADISRTIPAGGKFTERQKLFYQIVLRAQLEVIQAIKPGVPFSRLNEIVKEIYLEELQKLGMAEKMEDVFKYYYHGVGHFLGLDTHDVGKGNVTLEPGMVLTVEPGIYVEEEAIGIRIEDDVLVTEDGCEVLSKAIIKTVEEIEAFMK
ncbi:MAG: aminopeptidase P family protein [Cellulosilyticaceae bacterium]